MHSIVLRLKSLFAIPFSLTIVLAIIEILRIFAFNRAFFGLMQNKKKYRNLLVSISLPINLKAFVIPLFPMSNKI